MGADEGLGIGVKLLIAVGIAAMLFSIYRVATTMINKGLSQATQLTSDFDDIDKQKYNGMSLMGGDVISAVNRYWEDTTCEIVVCTLDGVNAVYNIPSADGTYTVPFKETLSGMPTADTKKRPFTADYQNFSSLLGSPTINDATGSMTLYSSVAAASYGLDASGNVQSGKNALLVDAAKLSAKGDDQTLAGKKGYNALVSIGSAGFISETSVFEGSVQKDLNGSIRRITFVQK